MFIEIQEIYTIIQWLCTELLLLLYKQTSKFENIQGVPKKERHFKHTCKI